MNTDKTQVIFDGPSSLIRVDLCSSVANPASAPQRIRFIR